MTWDWGSPIADGLFAIMIGFALVLLAAAIAIMSGRAKVADISALRFW